MLLLPYLSRERLLLGVLAGSIALSTTGCAWMPRKEAAVPKNRAFIHYWPDAPGDRSLRLAVKDNIDMRGVVTTAGSGFLAQHGPPAKKDAPLLATARQRHVQIIGKTNMSEFAVAPSGFNEYFGTPRNPLSGWRQLIPGGSSSGSAVAVASGLADVAIGTDTAGSVRVPAACCGVVGLKTTHGLIPIKGIYQIDAKHLDTVGPLARDIPTTAKGMDLLQPGFAGQYAEARRKHSTGHGLRVGRLRVKGTSAEIDAAADRALKEAGFEVVELGPDFEKKWEQATKDGNRVAAAGAWISDEKFSNRPEINTRTRVVILAGRLAYGEGYREALARRKTWQRTLDSVFRKVDFIAVPTLQTLPPAFPLDLRIGILDARVLLLQNTVAVNFAGNPALAQPIPLQPGKPTVTSLQLIGPRFSEARLLNAGRLVEKGVKGS